MFHPGTASDCSSRLRTDINSQNSEEYQDFFLMFHPTNKAHQKQKKKRKIHTLVAGSSGQAFAWPEHIHMPPTEISFIE